MRSEIIYYMSNIYKQIKEKASIFTSEFELACGAITALEWVLQEDDQ